MHKKQVDQSCLTRYDQAYNSPRPLYGFVLLSVGPGILVSFFYSQIVSNRVDEIESSYERQNGGEPESHESNSRAVFYWYIGHLICRAFLGIIFMVLQYTYFYSNGFPFEFNCTYNGTVVSCENPTASQKRLWGILVCVTNNIVAFVVFVEVIYLLRRSHNHRGESGWNVDYEFFTAYFFGKGNDNEPGENVQLRNFENNAPSSIAFKTATLQNLTFKNNVTGKTLKTWCLMKAYLY